MRTTLLLYVCVLLCFNAKAQEAESVKESYDQILEPYYSNRIDLNYKTNEYPWIYSWGDLLLSYIRMYEATDDNIYLQKFIMHSISIQLKRNDFQPIWWTVIQESVNSDWESANALYTGRLIRPMAEFVYIVKNSQKLYYEELPLKLQVYIGSNTIITYGEYAEWLLGRVVASIDYMNKHYWYSCSKCYSKKSDPTLKDKMFDNSNEINFNASYAVAMLYIASIHPIVRDEYLLKSLCVIKYFESKLINKAYGDTYVWMHNFTKIPYKEDVNHGVFDIAIALSSNKFLGEQLFTKSNLNKFAHTFTYNIWDRNLNQFNNTVYGTLDGGFNEETCFFQSTKTPNFYGFGEILGWMPLYKYDDVDAYPNDIYSILLDHTVKLLKDDPTALRPPAVCPAHLLSGTTSLFGLTEVVKAQWEREDFNLQLFNRDLNYDQDFCAKKKLTVSPEETLNENDVEDGSFADPSFKEKKFIVRSGNTVNMTAGESITFLPGTVIEAGSNFSASIAPDACPEQKPSKSEDNATLFSDEELDSLMKEVAVLIKQDSIQMAQFDSTTTYNPIVTSPAKQEPTKQEEALFLPFAVFPNPIQSSIAITAPIKETTEIQIRLYDYTGRIIMDIQKPYNPYMQIETEAVSSGLYFLHLNSGDNEYREVLIKK